jgi:hypothetical protein
MVSGRTVGSQRRVSAHGLVSSLFLYSCEHISQHPPISAHQRHRVHATPHSPHTMQSLSSTVAGRMCIWSAESLFFCVGADAFCRGVDPTAGLRAVSFSRTKVNAQVRQSLSLPFISSAHTLAWEGDIRII